MKAAVIRGTQKIVIEDMPVPEPGPSQVLVKIRYSALCGSDVHRFQYGMANPGSVLGHEYIGEVVQTGTDVTLLEEGDRVVSGGGDPPARPRPRGRWPRAPSPPARCGPAARARGRARCAPCSR